MGCITEEERKKRREEKEGRGERERTKGDKGKMLVFLIF
jgi:hypothetical protein